MNRLYDRTRDPSAFRVSREDAVSGTLDSLRGRKYALLVTFKRNGEPVPSPVWMAVDDEGRVYVQTAVESGKVKRIRNDPGVLICASNVRGKPRGPVLQGTARVLTAAEWPHAEMTLERGFGLGRKLYGRAFPMSVDVVAYLEVAPVADI